MNAPTYTAKDFAVVFGSNYSTPEGVSPGLMIPLNALHSCSEEIGVLSIAANEDHVDFEIVLLRVSYRMELAAEIGHAEILALLERVTDLEAKLAAATKVEDTQ